MSHICVFKPQTHWPYKSLMFWRLSCKILSHKTNFIDSSLPAFSLSFSRSDYLKHFSFCHRFNLLDRYIPFSCFFFTFLLDHIGQNFWVSLLLPIHQICWYCTFLYVLDSTLGILLFVFFDSLFHLYFFFKPLFIENFSLYSF